MLNTGAAAALAAEDLNELARRALAARATVLTATSVAASGHPGGSFSSMELYTLLYGTARLRPAEPRWEGRDRIVISHGHTSPGAYAALANAGFFPPDEVAAHFRQTGSVFEGHVERSVPGIEWSTGNLGQGLSAGVGFALGARLTGADWHTFVAMSDGEQMKGQVGEARRLAAKEGLGALTAVVDWNGIQISGRTEDVMPVALREQWEADGWRVYECDGHDLGQLHECLRDAVDDGMPSVVLAHTVIGKGVSFMEGREEFHGRGLDKDEYQRAMAELGASADALGAAVVKRAGACTVRALPHETEAVPVHSGEARTYESGTLADNRSAWGHALVDLARENPEVGITVFDCDLAVSVKTDGFAAERPEAFVQCGVGEHNAATVSGAVSTVPGVLSFWSDFGVFGIDEVYNQQRLNGLNGAALKLAVTHCGLDVGEDGKTHQCLDYVGAFRDLYGWRVIVPADPNQTDRAVRAAAAMQGCVALAMGRSKLPVITDEAGRPLFAGGYRFDYGRLTWAREGDDACVLVCGTPAAAAVQAADRLRDEGLSLAVGVVACPLALDDADMRRVASASLVMTVEDHNVATGLGASVAAWLAGNGVSARLVTVGVSGFQPSGPARELMAGNGLDADGIARRVRAELAQSLEKGSGAASGIGS